MECCRLVRHYTLHGNATSRRTGITWKKHAGCADGSQKWPGSHHKSNVAQCQDFVLAMIRLRGKCSLAEPFQSLSYELQRLFTTESETLLPRHQRPSIQPSGAIEDVAQLWRGPFLDMAVPYSVMCAACMPNTGFPSDSSGKMAWARSASGCFAGIQAVSKEEGHGSRAGCACMWSALSSVLFTRMEPSACLANLDAASVCACPIYEHP